MLVVLAVRRGRRWLLGPHPGSILVTAHCVHAMAETFLTVSLAGSLFFSVSPFEARPRVLLYLVVTIAPLLMIVPFIGPFTRRVRAGPGSVLVVTFVARCAIAIVLAAHLRSPWLYPLAFGWLVTAKMYTVARNALLPSLVDRPDGLVAANARLSRSATLASGAAAAVAATLYASLSGSATLIAAAGVLVVGAIVAWRVRNEAAAPGGRPVDRMAELTAWSEIGESLWDMAALRAAAGFALFHFGFGLRNEGEPAWIYGAVIVANGIGAFIGTVVAPVLRTHVIERHMLTIALGIGATAVVINGLAFNNVTLMIAMAALGLSVSVGRRAFDATLQRDVAPSERTAVFARQEARLELAWVLGAVVAVSTRVATWVGAVGLAGFLVTATIVHYWRQRSESIPQRREILPLELRLLERAEALAQHGYFDEAVAVADCALHYRTGLHEESTLPESANEASGRQLNQADAARSISTARRQLRQTSNCSQQSAPHEAGFSHGM